MPRNCTKHRIRLALVSQCNFLPAELWSFADQVGRTIGSGKYLATQTYAKRGFSIVSEVSHQRGEVRQIRVYVVIHRALPATKNDNCIVLCAVLRQCFAKVWFAVVTVGARFLERRADLAKASGIKVLDDKDVHVRFVLVLPETIHNRLIMVNNH